MNNHKKQEDSHSAENALKKSEEKYRMLIELAVDAFFQGDQQGNFITVNDKAIDLTGYSRPELLKMNIRELFNEEMLFDKPLRYDLLANGETIKTERQINCKDGRLLFVEMHSKAMPDGTYQSFFRDITEIKQAEAAKFESEEKYKRLYKSLMDGYVYVNMHGFITDSNDTFQQMVGYTATELASLHYENLTPATWHELERKIVTEQILTDGHSSVYQKEYIKKDGTIFPVELRTFLIKDSQGANQGMWAIARDITERKMAEEALKKSEERFRSIVESSPTAMYFYHLDPNNQLILTGANPASDLIIGISHKQLVGKTIEQAFPNLADTNIPGMYKAVAKNEIGPQSFEIKYADERFSGYYNVHVFRTGLKDIAVDFIDITRRHQTEADLRRSHKEYRDTLDALPDWIYVIDSQFKIAMVNAALRTELIKHAISPDCLGLEISTAFPFITENTVGEIEAVFNTGIVSISEHKVDLNDKVLHVEVSRVPILKESKVEKVILLIRDRSKEKEIEELKQRNAEQKEVLLREIHHRVKNNLAIVISLLNFQLGNNKSTELAKVIVDIQMRIRSMALIHEHLYRSENLDRIPLANYIESLSFMVLSTFSGKRINLTKNLDSIEVSIETALPIGLIINELLTNAFKYAFPDKQEGEIQIILHKQENELCLLQIRDNGVGLPATSSMNSEKSLGLYIVRLLVEQLDGSVTINRDQGTAFQIIFRNIIPDKKGRLGIHSGI